MHPSFSSLFVHPESHKPLAFFGNVEDGDGIPVHVLSPAQTWPEEIVKKLEKMQGEKWIEKRWTNGFLWAYGEREMYPVIGGIPVFVLPLEQTWPPLEVKKLREGKWIERNWENAGEMLKEEAKLTEFTKRMAEREGLILDVASGPGGGFVPRILHMNLEAKILMNEIGFGVLQEWQRFLRDKGIPNVSFALFDARKMPLKSNSIDIVSDQGGFNDIIGSMEAIKEAYRVLKPGGTLFSVNGMIERDDFLKLPSEVRTKWYNMNPPGFDGFLEVFKHVGFKVICNTVLRERELSPKEGDLPGEADKYGVRLHMKNYCTEVTK